MGGFSDSDIIVSVMESLCVKIGATETETQKCVGKVRERRWDIC